MPVTLRDRDESRPLVSFVGRLSDQKGVGVLMERWTTTPGIQDSTWP